MQRRAPQDVAESVPYEQITATVYSNSNLGSSQAPSATPSPSFRLLRNARRLGEIVSKALCSSEKNAQILQGSLSLDQGEAR